MRFNDREKSNFALNSSIGVVIVSTILFIISSIYIAISYRFPFWWTLVIIVSLQTIVSFLYCLIIITKIDVYKSSLDTQIMNKFLILIILEFLFLNIFAFLYGVYAYKKIIHKTKYIL
ncbi:hypothetical protein [Spiroplasma diminutum]|uniref:Transmembrane protein n=1 Tax=Spiroplasma diminutum CUAS-1 TaxID=1276221 RepID=S5M053_9MOLU|nr:hypothetical protein [Spiroplasma diminutum]AGR42216.1 hypothetical protein SDIMI_v3c05120 [Spiroplasma diminutum CUAS-1]